MPYFQIWSSSDILKVRDSTYICREHNLALNSMHVIVLIRTQSSEGRVALRSGLGGLNYIGPHSGFSTLNMMFRNYVYQKNEGPSGKSSLIFFFVFK